MEKAVIERKLREYQEKAARQAMLEKNVVIPLPQSTGKTIIGLNIIKSGNFKKTLILVHRKNLINSWIERAGEWLEGQLTPVDASLDLKSREKIYKSSNVIITTIHLFKRDLKRCLTFLSDFDLIIVDESGETVAKYTGGYRASLFFDALGNTAHAKVIGLMPPFMSEERLKAICDRLHATIVSIPYPELRDYLPVYGIKIYEVDDSFVVRVDKIIGKKIRRLHVVVFQGCKKSGMRITSEGVYGLSPKEVEKLDEKIQRAYWRLRNLLDFRQKLLNGHVERLRDSRLHKHSEGKSWLDSPNKKIEKLVEITRERANRKVMVFCRFKEILVYLRKELERRKLSSCTITGDMIDREERRKVMDRFRFGDVNLLLATDVLDAGVDVPQGDTIVHYTFSWDAYRHRQKSERIRGGEQVFIVYEGTSEAEKLNGLLKKLGEMQSRFVLDGYKSD